MEYYFCINSNKYLYKYISINTSIEDNAIELKYTNIETINAKLFLETIEFLVNNIIKKPNFDDVKYQLNYW